MVCLHLRSRGRWIADVVSETEGDGEVWLAVVSTPSSFDGRTLRVLLRMRATFTVLAVSRSRCGVGQAHAFDDAFDVGERFWGWAGIVAGAGRVAHVADFGPAFARGVEGAEGE